MSLAVCDHKNKKVGDIELKEGTIQKVNKAVLYYAVKAERNNRRHGTAAVKDRSDIKLTNKKIYRQKGTGNARHGARSANIFVGGGSAHGPRPRSYSEKLNKKFKNKSYQEVFKYLIQNEGIKVLKDLDFDKPATKQAAQILNALGVKKAVVVIDSENDNARLSFRNLRDVTVTNVQNLSLYEMLRFNTVVIASKEFETLKERYAL